MKKSKEKDLALKKKKNQGKNIYMNPMEYTEEIIKMNKRKKSIRLTKTDKNIINDIYHLFKNEFWIREVIKNKSKTLLPPFVMLHKGKFSVINPQKHRSTFKMKITHPIALYDIEKKRFTWIKPKTVKMLTSDFYKDMKVYKHAIITNIDIDQADQLAMSYRVLFYDIGMELIDNNKKPITSNFTIFNLYEKYKLYALIDLGVKDLAYNKLSAKLGVIHLLPTAYYKK